MSRASQERSKRGEILRWMIPAIACVIAIPLTLEANRTGADMRQIDPCVTRLDNMWSIASSTSLWIAVLSSIVLTVIALLRNRPGEYARGWGGIAFVVGLSTLCWMVADGGYGWRCNE